MMYSCALIFFLCSSGCLLTVSLFSDRWMLVEVAIKQSAKIKVTTYVTVGLWETRRVRYYHYYHHFHPFYHHHQHVIIYHESDHHHPIASKKAELPSKPTNTKAPPPTAAPPTSTVKPSPTAAAAAAAAYKSDSRHLTQTYFASQVSEKTLHRLSDANSGALIAIRILLFLGLALAFGALVVLLVNACNDTSVIRHRYKEKKLAATMAGMCAIALLLSIASWAVFLGTMYQSVQSTTNGPQSLNTGFVCCVLATVSLIVSIVLSACTVNEE